MNDFINKNIEYLSIILRYLVLLLLGMIILILFLNFQLKYDEYIDILPILLSTTGITIAIIISFIFTKLFTEKNERIERKRLIDLESKKVTAFRKICHFFKGSFEFWTTFGNLKNKLDKKYINLSLKSYDSSEIDYETYSAFCEEVNYGELGGQAYVGLRLIEGKEYSDINYLDSQLRKNYTLKEIADINDASGRIWSFFDHYKRKMVEIGTVSELQLNQIKKNILIIYPEYNIDNLDNVKLQNTFSDFQESTTRKLYYLTQKNSASFGKQFNLLLTNLSLFVIMIIVGVMILSLNYKESVKIFHLQIYISFFILLVIDLLVNVVQSIRNELIIEEFYEL